MLYFTLKIYLLISKSYSSFCLRHIKNWKNIYVHHYKSSFYIVHRMNQNGSMQICAIYFISRSLKSLLHTLIKYFFLFSNGKISMVTIVSGYSFLCFKHIFKNAYLRNKVQGNDYEIWFTKNYGKKFLLILKVNQLFF